METQEKILSEIDQFGHSLTRLSRLNFRYSGAIINAAALIKCGWTDITGHNHGHEWLRDDCTWMEYTRRFNDVVYHVTLATSQAFSKNISEDGYSYQPTTVDNVTDGLLGKGELRRWFRCVEVWVFDVNNGTFTKTHGPLPDDVLAKAIYDLSQAEIVGPHLLASDLNYQTDGYESYDGVVRENQVEDRFAKLLTVIDQCIKKNNHASISREFLPFAQAMLTDVDPDGRKLLNELRDGALISRLLSAAISADSIEGVVSIIKVSVINCGKLPSLEVAHFERLSEMLLERRLIVCAAEVVRMIADREVVDVHDSRFTTLQKLLLVVRKLVLERPKAVYDDFLSAMEYFAMKIDAHDSAWALLKACRAMIKTNSRKYDYEETHWLRDKADMVASSTNDLPPGVACPYMWQAFIKCASGKARQIVFAFPDLPTEHIEADSVDFPFRPMIAPDDASVWKWLGVREENWMPDALSTIDTAKVTCHERQYDANDSIDLNEGTTVLHEHLDAGSKDIAIVRVQTRLKNREEFCVSRIFPFLPKGRSDNLLVSEISIWKMFLWHDHCAADVLVALSNGKLIRAVAPYFAIDRKLTDRGKPYVGRVAGFVHEVRKLVAEDVPPMGWFIQFNVNGNPVESNFAVGGRVIEIREMDLLGRRVICYVLQVRDLPDPLPVYVGRSLADEGVAVGDMIRAKGWLYVDPFEAILNYNEFKRRYPNGVPELPDVSAAALPNFVPATDAKWYMWRSKKITMTDIHDAAKRKLLELKGVDRVVKCVTNPQRFDFFMRRWGKWVPVGLFYDDSQPGDFNRDRVVYTQRNIMFGKSYDLYCDVHDEEVTDKKEEQENADE